MALTLYSSSRSLASPGTAPRAITEESVMLLVGLTGNIGSGKSTVAQMLSERGATIIDADVLARRAVELGTAGFEKIIAKWGAAVLGPDGHLDRAALRRVVFADHEQLEELNQIVHPEVERLRGRLVEQARKRGDRLVICDIPLLFERHMTDRFDRIILVDAHRGVRLERLVKDRGLTETEAIDMIAAQMPAELKRARADFIIENDGTLTQLERRVQDVWSSLSNDSSAPRTAAAVP
jgi:dephospho-CoA kinase